MKQLLHYDATELAQRAHFAAHAPEPPSWFSEHRLPVTASDGVWNSMSLELREKFVQSGRPPEGGPPVEFAPEERALIERLRVAMKWDEKMSQHWFTISQEARWFAWRAYYADRMMETLSKVDYPWQQNPNLTP